MICSFSSLITVVLIVGFPGDTGLIGGNGRLVLREKSAIVSKCLALSFERA